MHFDESGCNLTEAKAHQSHIAAEFSKDALQTMHDFDCYYIHFSSYLPSLSWYLVFFLDIGAPRSVVGKSELQKVLYRLERTNIPLQNPKILSASAMLCEINGIGRVVP